MKKNIPYSIFHIPARHRQPALFKERCAVAGRQYSTRKGFTLVELLVTIGIFIFMTSVVLAKYRSFSTNSDFANAVEGIVLSLREAQVYGVGSKTAGGSIVCPPSPDSAFNCAYGIYLSKISGKNGSYIIFIDTNKDGLYSAGEPIVQTINLWDPSEIWISEIMVNNTNTDTLAVTFKRPNPDAMINGGLNNTSAKIILKKGVAQTNSSVIEITSSGQISIQ